MSQLDLLQSALKAFSAIEKPQSVMVGFDGFIDEIIHLVDQRQGVDKFTRMEKMKDLAARIDHAAGKSCNIEMVVAQAKLGGNGPIMANALGAQNRSITYVGALGKDSIHPVFQEFSNQCDQVITFSDPGHTDALEFFDGKIMLGKMQPLVDVNWDELCKHIGEDKFSSMLSDVDLIACVNWTMLPCMNTILKGMARLLSGMTARKTVFIDLTDPRKRTSEDLLGVLNLLTEMQSSAEMVLGLNDEESRQVASVLKIPVSEKTVERAIAIREQLQLHMVVVHPVEGAVVATSELSGEVKGPYTKTPNLTTGAGDNFNAGFCSGLLAGLSPEECLMTGVCTSGFYVRHCHSPNRDELLTFMKDWAESACGEI